MTEHSKQRISSGLGGEDFFRSLCANAAVAMVAADADGKIVVWNVAAAELLGVEEADMLGHTLEEIVPPGRRQALRRLAHRVLVREMASSFELRMPTARGQSRDLLFVLSPVPGPQENALGVSAWILEQTSSKHVSDELLHAEKMASLGTLAGGVAHHFNNIIGGVAMFVDFALSSGDPASMRRALEMTAEAAVRISDITQSLLNFATHGRLRADLADLAEVVLTFVHLSERPLAEHDITLKLDLQPVTIIEVEAGRMHQVLANLLGNAEDAMPAGGTITVTLRQTTGKVVLDFADTGIGIEGDQLSKIFEPFYTTKGLLSGGNQTNPGLGLSVVHGIIEELGGDITVESKIGAGTTFHIWFPIPSDRKSR